MNKIKLNHTIEFSKEKQNKFFELVKPLYLSFCDEMRNTPGIEDNLELFAAFSPDSNTLFHQEFSSYANITKISKIKENTDHYYVEFENTASSGSAMFLPKTLDIENISQKAKNLFDQINDLRLRYFTGLPLDEKESFIDISFASKDILQQITKTSNGKISNWLYYCDSVLDNIDINITSNAKIDSQRCKEILDEISNNYKNKMQNILCKKREQAIIPAITLGRSKSTHKSMQ